MAKKTNNNNDANVFHNGNSRKSSSSKGAPLKFNAGGRSTTRQAAQATTALNHETHDASSSSYKHEESKEEEKEDTIVVPTKRTMITNVNTRSNTLTILQNGIHRKRSPLHIQNWIACVLTLDGRDKFTKVLQYTSRFLSWYFNGLYQQQHQQQLYQILSQRFHLLYKSLVESRKAFRLGRSIIEYDKLRSMGWGEYVKFLLLHPLAGGVADGDDVGAGVVVGSRQNDGKVVKEGGATISSPRKNVNTNNNLQEHHHEFGRYDTHPIEEGDEDAHEEDHQHDDDDEASWNEEEEDEEEEAEVEENDKVSEDEEDNNGNSTNQKGEEEEKKCDIADPSTITKQKKSAKVISRPNRPVLPSRISSNIGWGPTTTTTTTTESTITDTTTPNISAITSTTNPPKKPTHSPPLPRTVSEMGRQMYRPFPSRSSSMGSYKQVIDDDTEDAPSSKKKTSETPHPITTTPTWKLIGGTLKLLGLMGFWACDNISFLTGTGFLDPISTKASGSSSSSSSSSSTNTDAKSVKEERMQRKSKASAWGARFYFMASVAGLVVNTKEILKHRRGALREARAVCSSLSGGGGDASKYMVEKKDGVNTQHQQVQEAKLKLKQAEGKHFELFLALMKSLCDVMVFSNNPGVDLHLKLRGKKNHEGLHCVGGLISASTVLYNNFPNAEVKL